MSATGQAAAGDAQAAGGEGGQQQAQGFDAAALQQQLQQTAGGVDDLRQQFGSFLESAPWAQAPAAQEQAPADDGIDLSFLDNPGMDDQAVQKQFATIVQQAVDSRVQAALTPVTEGQDKLRREAQARDLVGEFPEFQDEKIAQRIAGPQGLAVQLANDLGAPQLAMEPSFWRLVHMADRAAAAANTEGGESATAAHLEGGGGANPGAGPDAQQQMVDRIFGGGANGRLGSRALPPMG